MCPNAGHSSVGAAEGTRLGIERATNSEPEAVAEALALIGAMYGHEKQIPVDVSYNDCHTPTSVPPALQRTSRYRALVP